MPARNSTSEREPLLPTSRQDIDQYQPSKASAQKAVQIYAALKAGKLPTQKQANEILQQISNSSILNTGSHAKTSRFSQEGELVVEDLRAVIDSLQTVGSNKNGDDKFQRFLYLCSQADADFSGPSGVDGAPSQKEARADGQKALESVKTLGNLLITSGEFRNIVSDMTFVARDLFADAAQKAADQAQKAADKSRPSEDERQKGIDTDPERVKQRAKALQKKYKTGRLDLEAREKMVQGREWLDDQEFDLPKDEIIERLKKLVVSVQKNKEYHSSIDTLVNLVKKYATKAQQAARSAANGTDVETNDEADEALKILRETIEGFAGGKSLDDAFKSLDKVVEDVKNDERLSKYFNELGSFVERLLHDEGYVLSSKASRRAENFVDRGQELIESNAAWKEDTKQLGEELKAYQTAFEAEKDTKRLVQNLQNLSEDLADFADSGMDIFSAKARGFARDFVDVIVPRLIAMVKEIPLPRVEYVSRDLDLAIDDFTIKSVSFIPDKIQFINRNDIMLEQGYAAFASNFDTSARLKVTGLRFSAENIAYYVNSKKGMGWEDSGLLSIDLTDEGLSADILLENADEDDRESFFKVKKVDIDLSSLNFSVSQSDHWFFNTLFKPLARPLITSVIKQALEGQLTSALQDADKGLYGFQQRATGSARAASGPVDLLRGIFNVGPSPSSMFTSSPSAKRTNKGVVVTGAHGEYKLAIGADEMLLPGRGGPSASYEKRKAAIEQAKIAKKKALGAGRTAGGDAERAVGKAKDTAGALASDAKKAERKERSKDGWKSDAFNISSSSSSS